MWSCMSGRAPPAATDRTVLDTLKPAVRTFGRHYSRPLLEAVDWCLKMDPAARPQSVQELLDFMNQSWLAKLEEGRGGYLQRVLLWLRNVSLVR